MNTNQSVNGQDLLHLLELNGTIITKHMHVFFLSVSGYLRHFADQQDMDQEEWIKTECGM